MNNQFLRDLTYCVRSLLRNRTFTVMLVNDYDHPVAGRLRLTLENEKGNTVAETETTFSIGALGDQTLQVPLAIPSGHGRHTLKATALPTGKGGPTCSRRWVELRP